jgi:hypothetical protein
MMISNALKLCVTLALDFSASTLLMPMQSMLAER